MKRHQALKDMVRDSLRDDEQSRNSDIRLFNYLLVNRFGHFLFKDADGDYAIKLKALYDVPSQDNVKRARAVIQNGDHEYLPTTDDIRRKRQISESDWYYWLINQR